MPDWARTALKWTGALVVMALVVAYTLPRAFEALTGAVTIGDEDDAAEQAGPAPDEDEAEPETTSDVALGAGAARASRGTIANVGLGTSGLTAADQHVLIAFPPFPTRLACITEAELVVRVDTAEGEPQVRLHATRLGDLDGTDVGDPLPADAIVESEEDPVAAVSADTTSLRWPADGVVAVAAAEAPDDGGLVLALRFAQGSSGEAMFVTSPGDEDRSPQLRWTAAADCPA